MMYVVCKCLQVWYDMLDDQLVMPCLLKLPARTSTSRRPVLTDMGKGVYDLLAELMSVISVLSSTVH
jgi:hypothetical protein